MKHTEKTIDLTKAKINDTGEIVIQLRTGTVHVTYGPESHGGLRSSVYVQLNRFWKPGTHKVEIARGHDNENSILVGLVEQAEEPAPLVPDPKPAGTELPDDVTGKYIILNQLTIHGDLKARTVYCTGGGGAKKNSLGTKVYVRDRANNEYYVRCGDVSRLATKGEIKAAFDV